MNNPELLQWFSALDVHFARLMATMSCSPDDRLFLAAALLSRSARSGDVCLDLGALASRGLAATDGDVPSLDWPTLAAWIPALRSSAVVGEPGQKRPLILDDRNRLYLYRYWDYERQVARCIRERATPLPGSMDLDLFREAVQYVFPPDGDAIDERQRAAAAMALLQRLCVITGGPGTGKTFTIARALALIAICAGKKAIRTLLAAPTGKAAARLRETLQHARTASEIQRLPGLDMPIDVLTVHRLLKSIPGSPYFQHNRTHPLPADVVVVDEASMVDLALMAKLMDAVPDEAKLILVGDKDQLASVEAGSVLGDICDRLRPHDVSSELSAQIHQATGIRLSVGAGLRPGLQDCVIELQKSYRFLPGSGIGELSRAVIQGDAARAVEVLSTDSAGSVTWLRPEMQADIEREIEQRIMRGYRACYQDLTPPAALEALRRFKILCAHKAGPLGVHALNRMAERVLKREGCIEPSAGGGLWYGGRPILITRNDYALGLFNGDVGIALIDPDSREGPLFVFFPEAGGGLRRFLPYRLPAHETAYAMTVHKSQGSEFDDILLILPDRDSPLVTRELIYTALTRARRTIAISARRSVLAAGIQRRIERASGLRDALWGSRTNTDNP